MSCAPEKRHTVRVLAAAGISIRRACELVGTSRSHLAYEAKIKDDAELLAAIGEIRRRKPRWGVRRTHRQLRRRGHAVDYEARIRRRIEVRNKEIDVPVAVLGAVQEARSQSHPFEQVLTLVIAGLRMEVGRGTVLQYLCGRSAVV